MIEVEGLRKEYRRLGGNTTVAVDGLDLHVPAGGVYGFLGPNGSGKTTTIRCLLGLASPSGGTCRLLGVETPAKLPSVIDRVGAIVETPALYPAFSGRRNLSLLAGLIGRGDAAVDGVLERVGLAERADDRTKTYSLGMRQRLGIAAALLKDPELLILDEPANGLDPAGIVEIRRLMRALADEGRTVFVSSHQLGEIEQTCDRVAILDRGRCVADGAVRDVLAAGQHARLVLRLDAPEKVAEAVALLRSQGHGAEAAPALGVGHLVVEAGAEHGARINAALGSAGLWLAELRVDQVTLEDVFLQLTAPLGGPPPPGSPPPPGMAPTSGFAAPSPPAPGRPS